MLTLNLSAYEMQQLEQESKRAGMSINQYAVSRLFPQPPKPQTIADMVKDKRLESFKGEPVTEQREMRADTTPAINPMIARVKSLPKPTSFTNKNAVELQREWRSEWE